MIGNEYLQNLYLHTDESTSMNQLLEHLKSNDCQFLASLINEPVDLNIVTKEELIFLTKVSALIDYYLQINDIEVPVWLRNEKLRFEKPYYYTKRISDFEKIKLQYTNPAPFKARNVYFQLEGIRRV